MAQAENNNPASGGAPLMKHKFSEVAVERKQYPFIGPREAQQFIVTCADVTHSSMDDIMPFSA